MPRGVSDDELLKLIDQTEDPLGLDDDVQEPAVAGDPCPACGEPAENLGDCRVCHAEGCLPAELWTPGQADPCLTLCVRCARTIHIACSSEDGAGNPRCPDCRF